MCSLEKRGSIFILTLTGAGDHRLNPPLLYSILTALAEVKANATAGSALITTNAGDSFCPGFDVPWALAAGTLAGARERLALLISIFRSVVAQLLSLRIPTVAAISGDAAAAGLALAVSHDYLIMRRDVGALFMREVDLGLTLPDYFAALFKSKMGSRSAHRDLIVGGVKLGGDAAVRSGIVETAHDGADGVMRAAVELGEKLAGRKWEGEAYAELRKSLYPEVTAVLGLPTKDITISKL